MLAVEGPEPQAACGRGRRDQRIGNLHAVRLRIPREVRAGLARDPAVQQEFAAGFEEGLSPLLFPRSHPRIHLGPGDGGAERRHTRLLKREGRAERASVAPQNLDDDVRIQDDAGQLRARRLRRVSRRSRLTYASVSPRSSRFRHNPAMPRNVVRRSSVLTEPYTSSSASRTRSDTVRPLRLATALSRAWVARSR